MDSNIPVVILAGGLGLRMRDYPENIPKALVPIGDMPVIKHVMKIYAHQGFDRFIICLGYKGEAIKEYFINNSWKSSDFTLRTGEGPQVNLLTRPKEEMEITFADTGIYTPTGGRIKKIEKYIESEDFFVTYTDGLADVRLADVMNFHRKTGKIATLTAVHPASPFGILDIDGGVVKSFKEKPNLPGYINGGFFTFSREIFDYLDNDSILEEGPLRRLSEEGQLAAFRHEGFWACMDTPKDVERLNKLWYEGVLPGTDIVVSKPPWKVWDE